MSHTAETKQLNLREGLSRELAYRPHLKVLYYSLIAIAVIWELGVVLAAALAYSSNGGGRSFAILAAGSIFPIIFYLEARFLVKPLAFSTVLLRADGIVLNRLGKSIEINFSDITEVNFPHLPYLGGWFVLRLKNGKHYRFTVVLERSDYVLEAIAQSNQALVSDKNFLSFRRTAVISDHSWARLHTQIRDWRSLALKYAGFPLLLTATIVTIRSVAGIPTASFLASLILISVLNVLMGFAVWLFAEMLFLFQLRKQLLDNPNAVRRDVSQETKAMRILTGVHMGLSVLIAIWTYIKIF